MITLDVEVEGNIQEYMAQEAAAVFAGAQRAVKRQTDETKNAARAVVNVGLTGSSMFKTGNRRVAQTIRSRDYPQTPAGFVHSTWGYFEGGRFIDILNVHTTGRTILPRHKKMLFIPFVGGARRRGHSAPGLAGREGQLDPDRGRSARGDPRTRSEEGLGAWHAGTACRDPEASGLPCRRAAGRDRDP